MMGHVCKNCGSYAINPHMYGRELDVDLDLCDVCYWRKRAVIKTTLDDEIRNQRKVIQAMAYFIWSEYQDCPRCRNGFSCPDCEGCPGTPPERKPECWVEYFEQEARMTK